MNNKLLYTISVVYHSHSRSRSGCHQVLGARERHIRHVVGIVRKSGSKKTHHGRHDGLGKRRRLKIIRTSTYKL